MNNCLKANFRSLLFDSIFIIICYFCVYLYGMLSGDNSYLAAHPIILVLGIAAAIIIIRLVPVKINDKKVIYKDKKALIPFIILESVMLVFIILMNKLFHLNNSSSNSFNTTYLILMQLCISLSVLICYFFNVKLKFFNWNISLKSFILVVISFITIKLIWNFSLIYNGRINIGSLLNINSLMKFTLLTIYHSAYPAFFEEVLYRGFLISALKWFGLTDTKCNVIQSIIFGLSHTFSWGPPSLISLLIRSSQALIGYVLGKIYFKTKSLLPCILFHGLIDTSI